MTYKEDDFDEFMGWMFFNDMEKEGEDKFYCESCGKEITEEEYEK